MAAVIPARLFTLVASCSGTHPERNFHAHVTFGTGGLRDTESVGADVLFCFDYIAKATPTFLHKRWSRTSRQRENVSQCACAAVFLYLFCFVSFRFRNLIPAFLHVGRASDINALAHAPCN